MMGCFAEICLTAVTGPHVLFGVVVFLASFILSILVIGFILVKLPATVFKDRQRRDLWIDHHPVIRWTGIVLKNACGIGLVGLGILLLFLPGQGLLTMLIGLLLVDFPGKRSLERKLLGRPGVFRRVNALRARFGQAPFELDADE